MISYIVNNQNSYVFANLFKYNFVDLVNKGVQLSELLQSNIFNPSFDFDEWPSTSTDTKKMIKPYNLSIFSLRHQYPVIFRKLWLKEQNKQLADEFGGDSQNIMEAVIQNEEKQYKIKYYVNMLTSMSEEDGQIIEAIANSEELEIFQVDVVKDLIDYKWKAFAASVHWFGWLIHMLYILALQMYIAKVYLVD
jgi:hypothetical protein